MDAVKKPTENNTRRHSLDSSRYRIGLGFHPPSEIQPLPPAPSEQGHNERNEAAKGSIEKAADDAQSDDIDPQLLRLLESTRFSDGADEGQPSSPSNLLNLEHWSDLTQKTASDPLSELPGTENSMKHTYELILNAMEYDVKIVDIQQVQFTELIGSGANMNVYKGIVNGSVVAIKRVRPFYSTSNTLRKAETTLPTLDMEIRVMSDLFLQDHENIAKLRALSWEISRDGELVPILIMDLAEPTCPSLYDLMQNLEKWDYCRKAYLISDIICGLNAIHAENIVHGDLKPENLLCFRRRPGGVIDQTMPLMLKLTDFGFSEDIHPDNQSRANAAAGGTEYWNAPECMPEAPYEMQSFARKTQRDLYSCGLVLWYILDSNLPLGPASGPEWESNRMSIRADKISGAVYSRYTAWFPENMRRIWNPDAQADVDQFKAELEEELPFHYFSQNMMIRKIKSDPLFAEQVMFDELLFRGEGKVAWFFKNDDGQWEPCSGYLPVMVPNVIGNMLQAPSERRPVSAALHNAKLHVNRTPQKIYNYLDVAYEDRKNSHERKDWNEHAVRYRHPFASARRLQNISPQMHASLLAEIHKDADAPRPTLRATLLLFSIYGSGYGVPENAARAQQYMLKALDLSAGTKFADFLGAQFVALYYNRRPQWSFPFDQATELKWALKLFSQQIVAPQHHPGPILSPEHFELRVADAISDLEWNAQSRFLRISASAYLTHQMIKESNRTDPLLRKPEVEGSFAAPEVRGNWVNTLLRDDPDSFEILQESGALPEELRLANEDMDAFLFAVTGIRQMSRQEKQMAMLQGMLKRSEAEKNLIRICADYGLVKLLQHLITKHGIDINRKLGDGRNALQEVLEQGRIHRAISLLSCGADVKAIAEKEFVRHICADGHSKAIDFWAQLHEVQEQLVDSGDLNLALVEPYSSIYDLFHGDHDDRLDLETQRYESYQDNEAPVVRVSPIYFSLSDNTWSTFLALLRYGVDPAKPVTGSLDALQSAVVMNRPLFVATLVGPEYKRRFKYEQNGDRSLFHLAALGKTYFKSDKIWVYGNTDEITENPEESKKDKDNHQRIVLALLHRNLHLDVDQRDGWGLTPFLLAVAEGNSTAADWFRNHNADVLATAADGATALHLAIASGNERMVDTILRVAPELLSHTDELGQTPLHWAVCQSNMAILGTVLSRNPDLDVLDCFARNPAVLALDHGQVSAFVRYVQAITETTGSTSNIREVINAKDGFGRSCAHVLPTVDPEQVRHIVKVLEGENGKLAYDDHEDEDRTSDWTPVHVATVGNPSLLDILATPETVNTKGYQGITPLHLAYLLQNKPLATQLIAKGANRHIPDDLGRLPEALLNTGVRDVEAKALLEIMRCVYKGKAIERLHGVLTKSVVVRPFMADVHQAEDVFVKTYLREFREMREGEEVPELIDLKGSFVEALGVFTPNSNH